MKAKSFIEKLHGEEVVTEKVPLSQVPPSSQLKHF
jgi:hypothetical protein